MTLPHLHLGQGIDNIVFLKIGYMYLVSHNGF